MSSPFDLPRADCPFVPNVETISPCPMTPKPLWTGAEDYCDPNYPSGAGPNDVPPAPPPWGEALPPTISPPAQTSIGGGGGGPSVDYELYLFENGGVVPVNEGDILKPSGCTGWSISNGVYLLELNDINSNLSVFTCVTGTVAPGSLGYCFCLSGRIYRKMYYDGYDLPKVYGSLGADEHGDLIPHLVGFRAIAIDSPEVHYIRDTMPSQVIKVTAVDSGSVTGQTVIDNTGTLGGVNIPGSKLTTN